MRTYLDKQITILDDIVTLDGPGDNRLDFCNSCGSSRATSLYRCIECSYHLLYCGMCILKLHTALPLHRLEVCSCSSFTSLYSSHPVLEGRFLRQDLSPFARLHLPSWAWQRCMPHGLPSPSAHDHRRKRLA